ncbi:hypothetical protein [Bacillus safensis]|uniref:hypothetical protein n=1 Tax=Bacillus safensis TaxID=561879 RepID=UPI002E1C9F45|nr:hypothetical protein [Bacillus safensis]
MIKIIKAEEIKVGNQLAGNDDFLWDVEEIIEETSDTITVRLCSDFSSFSSHWKTRKDGSKGGLIKSFSKTTELYANCA